MFSCVLCVFVIAGRLARMTSTPVSTPGREKSRAKSTVN
jgi:hypothetical protein